MPRQTSDGEVFKDHFEMIKSQVVGFKGSSNVSPNVEDDRTQADKWGSSFGPSEGGPPPGVDARDWYSPDLANKNPIIREAMIGVKNASDLPVVSYHKLNSADDLAAPTDGNKKIWRDMKKMPPWNEKESGSLYGRPVEPDYPDQKPNGPDIGQYTDIHP